MEQDYDNVDTLVIGCMDHRLNRYISELENGGNVVSLRNAGANVKALAQSIKIAKKRYKNIKKVIIMPHEDCGAMKAVLDVLSGLVQADPDVWKGLIKQFEKHREEFLRSGTLSREALEELNGKLQEAMAKKAFGSSIDVEVRLVKADELVVEEHNYREHIATLTIATPSTVTTYNLLERAHIAKYKGYVGKAFGYDELEMDCKVAKGLGVDNFVIVPMNKEEIAAAESARDAMTARIKNINIGILRVGRSRPEKRHTGF